MRIFLRLIKDLLQKGLFQKLQDVFDVYKQTELYCKLTAAVNGMLDQVLGKLAMLLYQHEYSVQATWNVEAPKAGKAEALMELKELRTVQRVKQYMEKQELPRKLGTAQPPDEERLRVPLVGIKQNIGRVGLQS